MHVRNFQTYADLGGWPCGLAVKLSSEVLPLSFWGRRAAAWRHNDTIRYTDAHCLTGKRHRFLIPRRSSRLYITGEEPLIEKSGDHDFDYALAHTLAKISQIFDVAPGFAYYDDYDGKNAYATKHIRSYGVDGTVLVGQRLLDRLRSGNDHPDVAVACVCAHEFGHILQYKLQLNDKVSDGQKTVKPVECRPISSPATLRAYESSSARRFPQRSLR